MGNISFLALITVFTTNMELDFEISAREYQRIVWKILLRRPFSLFLIMAGFGNLAVAILIFAGIPISIQVSPFVNLLFGIGLGPFILYVTYLQGKKGYQIQEHLHGRQQWVVTEEKLWCKGFSARTEVHWKSIQKILVLRDWLVIFTSPVTFHIIAKSAFKNDEEIATFKAYCDRFGVKMK